MISASAHPEADTTVTYTRLGSNPFSTVETYTYDNPEHLQSTEIVETGSNGARGRFQSIHSTGDYMARVTLAEIVDLVLLHSKSWQDRGDENPRSALQIVMQEYPERDAPVLDDSLASKTLSYEGHRVTVVLDFDDLGYLKAMEFV